MPTAGMRPGLIAATVIALTPVTAVLLLTMDYDTFSILTWILLLIALGRNGHWQLGAGLLAGIGDFEQIAVGVAMCCSSRHCDPAICAEVGPIQTSPPGAGRCLVAVVPKSG